MAGFNSAFKEHMQRGSQVWIAKSTDNKFQLLGMNMEDMGQIRSMNEVWIEGMLVQQFLQHLRRTFALDHITSAYLTSSWPNLDAWLESPFWYVIPS